MRLRNNISILWFATAARPLQYCCQIHILVAILGQFRILTGMSSKLPSTIVDISRTQVTGLERSSLLILYFRNTISPEDIVLSLEIHGTSNAQLCNPTLTLLYDRSYFWKFCTFAEYLKKCFAWEFLFTYVINETHMLYKNIWKTLFYCHRDRKSVV